MLHAKGIRIGFQGTEGRQEGIGKTVRYLQACPQQDGKLIDKISTYDDYLENDEMARRRQVLSVNNEEED